MAKKLTQVQIKRDIAKVLAKPLKRDRLHHVSVADDWDVATDAIQEEDATHAAQIVRRIRDECSNGSGLFVDPSPTPKFTDALEAAPEKVRDKFYELTEKDGGTDFENAGIARMYQRSGWEWTQS